MWKKSEGVEAENGGEFLRRLVVEAKEYGSASLWIDGKEVAHAHAKGIDIVVTIRA
jgi:hypothetical protein